MTAGFVVAADPTDPGTAASLNSYTVIRAEGRDAVGDLLRNHPFLAEATTASTSMNCPGK